jgi:hypothetical protein
VDWALRAAGLADRFRIDGSADAALCDLYEEVRFFRFYLVAGVTLKPPPAGRFKQNTKSETPADRFRLDGSADTALCELYE